jgi:hypothetical protein
MGPAPHYVGNPTSVSLPSLISLSISTNPTLDFIIIVNPNNGPGTPPWWPNADYVREIPKLNALPNVQTLGYVATTYCKRPISEVFDDIASYASWSSNVEFPSLRVDGIFFDETPNVYSDEAKTYLNDITKRVKEHTGIMKDRLVSSAHSQISFFRMMLISLKVIHNPGSAPDSRFADPGPDVTTVFEESYANFQTAKHQQWLSTSPYERERTNYMVHAVPEEGIERFVYELRRHAKYLFVTDLKVEYYHSLGKSWDHFVAALGSD